jgi:hypothetical protein
MEYRQDIQNSYKSCDPKKLSFGLGLHGLQVVTGVSEERAVSRFLQNTVQIVTTVETSQQ